MRVSSSKILKFQNKIYEHYRKNKRVLPWRSTRDPYRILISEVMLQQTQVSRVLLKYQEFIEVFSGFEELASAPLRKLLSVWQGMGYNRRALLLQKTAQAVTQGFQGALPRSYQELIELPGIGPYTASAIIAFAYNQPAPVLDTNIRRVYLHEFFKDQEGVADRQIKDLIEQTMDRKNPRRWFNALMDYGNWLASVIENPNRKSKHYAKQAPFEGSFRQVRSAVLKALLRQKGMNLRELSEEINRLPEVAERACDALIKEGAIIKIKGKYLIPE